MKRGALAYLLASTALSAISATGALAQQAPAASLPTIRVQGTDPDEPFRTPAANSTVTRDQIRESGDANRILETVPGVGIGGFASQPGVSVNIRGLEGVGRVNVMVEGVRQNFRNQGHQGGSFAYIDPNMIAGADVERGAVTGPGGMGALAGAVNFRLLNVDDILRPDQNAGGMLTLGTGTNGFQWNGLLAGAARFGNGISGLAAVSGRQNSDYENGRGITVPNTSQEPRSGLVRFNWEPTSEHRLTLTGSVYVNRFLTNSYDQTVQSNLGRVQYNYRPEDNRWVDMEVYASYNQVRMNNYLLNGLTVSQTATGRRIVNTAYEIGASNRSRFDLGGVAVDWRYGFQYATDDTETRRGGVNGDGRLSIAGVYSETAFTRSIFDFILGLRYDYYSTDASGYAVPAIGVPVSGDYDADNSEGRVSPRFTLAVRPLEGLQVYASYGWSFRPPTITEMMYSGSHGAGGVSTFYPNPYLQAERSQGWEIGTNILRRDVLTEGDRVRLKVAYYDNDVENLINMVTVRGTTPGGVARSFNFYENVPGTSRMQGVEIEGGYDIGVAYVNVAYTNAQISYAQGASRDFLPRSNLTVDLGTRLLDRNLIIGGRLRSVGRTQAATLTGGATPVSSYTTFDLYGSWKVHENVTLFVNATNISDEVYTLPAAETVGGGRGRTVVGGLTVRF